jgi:ABC-type oligopeptide transport system ATPase subunit
MVFRDGSVVEEGPTDAVYRHPRNDYTRELIAAIPSLSNALASRRSLAVVETTLHALDADDSHGERG